MMHQTKASATAPKRQKMDYQSYLKMAAESQITEWVDGEVINYMPPMDYHQDIARFLSLLIDSFITYFNLGILRFAPFEVKLWPDGPSREPDILFISQDNLPNLTPKRFQGGPDLLIEIVSASSVIEDRVRKLTQYEQAGVREYWIIDPRPHQQQADFFILNSDGAYAPAPVSEDGVYHSTVIPNFWLNLAWLWESPLPNSQQALAEIMTSVDSISPKAKAIYQALYELLDGR
ncbi:MAG: Uma2 family endonuclease [Candidatus Brocadiaceae bacterium]|nr:Uma2 family endonuclease [Candidatus Brocadiaceae bacterium]